MKTWVKILIAILIVLIIVMAAIVVYGIYTYNQVKEVVMLTQDSSIQQNFEAVMNGDCSKLGEVEAQASDIETKISALCNNFGLKLAVARGWVSSEQYASCKEINNPENEWYKALDAARAHCANKTVTR